MNNDKPFSEFAKLLPELLKDGDVTINPQGESMLPTIKQGDSVVLTKPSDLAVSDIVLYTRADGKAVLHRIVKINRDGTLVMRGDNQIQNESGITKQDVIAKAKSFTHKNVTISAKSIRFKQKFMRAKQIRFLKRVKNKIKK